MASAKLAVHFPADAGGLSAREGSMTIYRVTVALAGRAGTQTEDITSKRGAIRQVRRLVSAGGFGSAGEVVMIATRGPRFALKRTLIYQCYRMKTKQGKLATKVEEL